MTNLDTASGKDTLHDTVGIIFFQDIENTAHISEYTNCERDVSEVDDSQRESGPNPKKRRRTFDMITQELEPYTKKPKLTANLLSLDHPLRSSVPSNLKSLQRIN